MIIYAMSIHSGGGKVLLDHLLTEKIFGEVTHLVCDQRYILPKDISQTIVIHRVRPIIWDRWKAELVLKKIHKANPNEQILCFSNLPPAFKLNTKVILYLQNALLLPGQHLKAATYKSYLRLLYEKIWLNVFFSHVNEVWVQTPWMKSVLAQCGRPVLVKPFLPNLPIANEAILKKYDFITVSGSAPHKRLFELLSAWKEMPDPAPSLLVIADSIDMKLQNILELTKLKNVICKTNVNREEIFQHYQESKALIITSELESFCLPLYEAKNFNLKIIAPKEGYTKDILIPMELLENISPAEIIKKVQKIYKEITQ